jgi:hypothetical protein
LPKLESIKRRIRNIRTKRKIYSFNGDYDIPNECIITLCGEKYLQFDSGSDDQMKLMIFAGDSLLSFFRTSKILICNGTYKAAPSGFTKIFTVHYQIFDRIQPIFHIYMKFKCEQSYIKLFENFKCLVGEVQVKYIVNDFKIAITNAFKKTFPNVEMFFCLFHFGQIIYRNIQRLGFQEIYCSNVRFRNDMRKLLSLAFVKPEFVLKGYAV